MTLSEIRLWQTETHNRRGSCSKNERNSGAIARAEAVPGQICGRRDTWNGRIFVMPSSFRATVAAAESHTFSRLTLQRVSRVAATLRNEVTTNYPRSLAVTKGRVYRMQAVRAARHLPRALRFASLYDFQSYGFTARCGSIVAPLCPVSATATKRSARGSPIISKGPIEVRGKWWKN